MTVVRKPDLSIAAALAFGLFLTLGAASPFAQEKKLIIGYTARDLNNFPLFAAQARGYFKDAGKDVELVQIRSNIGLSGLLGGSVDYYTSFSSAVTLAAQQGSPIVGIFSMIERAQPLHGHAPRDSRHGRAQRQNHRPRFHRRHHRDDYPAHVGQLWC